MALLPWNCIIVTVFIIMLGLLASTNYIGVLFGPSTYAETTDDVTITKSITDDKFTIGDSSIVTVSIESNIGSQIKNASFTDIVPSVFFAEPKELFSNNILTKRLSPFEKNNVIIYSISPVKEIELSKNWTFPLSSAKVTYKIGNSNETFTKFSNSPSVTIVSKSQPVDWINDYWTLYLFILFLIATGSGALGGAISNYLKYRSQANGVITKVIRENNDYLFEVEYDNFIELHSDCNIKISSYAKNPGVVNQTPIFRCYLYCKNEAIHSFDVLVGRDMDNPLESKAKHPVIADDSYWKLGVDGMANIKVIIEKRSLSKDVVAGFASGFITLLFLIVTTNLVSNNTYPANLVSITTLSVSAFIAGFIPLQILDKATGQLQERFKVINAALADQNNENIRIREKLAKAILKGTELTAHVEQLPTLLPDKNINVAVQKARDFKSFLERL